MSQSAVTIWDSLSSTLTQPLRTHTLITVVPWNCHTALYLCALTQTVSSAGSALTPTWWTLAYPSKLSAPLWYFPQFPWIEKILLSSELLLYFVSWMLHFMVNYNYLSSTHCELLGIWEGISKFHRTKAAIHSTLSSGARRVSGTK